MVCVYEELGISEERNHEICNLLRDLVEECDTMADVIEHLLARKDLTDKERAYIIFVYGDANASAEWRRGRRR